MNLFLATFPGNPVLILLHSPSGEPFSKCNHMKFFLQSLETVLPAPGEA